MMYNKTLEDYTLSLARDMIHLDQANRIDDYLYNDGGDSWLDFLSDPGLIFFLIGEDNIPINLTLAEVIEDQFCWMKIDLAIAYALAARSDMNGPDPDTTEQSETADMLWRLLRRIGVVDLFPPYEDDYTAKQKKLFEIYQIRRRVRNAFRGLPHDGYAQQFLRDSLDEIIAYLESDSLDSGFLATWRMADSAINHLVRKLEDAGFGYYLRGRLYDNGVLADPYLYDRYIDGYDDDKDDYNYYD